MDTKVFQNFRASLLEQRQNLADWLSSTPAWKKQIRLGPVDEQAVQDRMQVLDEVIEKTEDQTLGICEVCHEDIEPSRLETDYTCCVCLDHLSEEEKDLLESDLEFSAKIQQALLPQQVPEIPGMELAAFSRPAEYVGGDYFDFFRFRDRAHGLVIGDAAGHGMSASLLMSNLQASLRILVLDYEAPVEVISRLNQLFIHNIHMTHFVTLFLARYDPQTSKLTYCNAGHNPPLLFRTHSGNTEPLSWLRPTGAAIGLVEEFQFETETVAMAPGDILLLYTDGVTEAINPQEEEFGVERLANLVRHGSHWSAQELVREVRRNLREFTYGQPLTDDSTIVACKTKRG